MKRLKIALSIAMAILVIMGFYWSDVLSGFKISRGIDRVLTTEEESIDYTPYKDFAGADNLNDYLYRNLDDNQKAAYDAIYNALVSFRNTAYVRYYDDSDGVFDIFNLVLSEHPELFWTVGEFGYNSSGILSLKYVYTKSEAMEKKKLIEEKADEILSSVSGDEYTRALAIYDYIILNTRYDTKNVDRLLEVPTDSTIEGVLLNNTAVCAGYAKAYQYLLQRAGMSAMYVVGIGTNSNGAESHAWVAHQIDGKNYYSDPTWGDTEKDYLVSHGYFCLTAAEISVNHELDDVYPLLTANSLEANYFVREDKYFDEYSVSAVKKVIDEGIENNKDCVEFRYKTQEQYEQALDRLFEKGEIYLAVIPSDLFKHSIETENMTIMKDDVNRVIMIVFDKYK